VLVLPAFVPSRTHIGPPACRPARRLPSASAVVGRSNGATARGSLRGGVPT
jgi:hypothetical protein